jgi:hypothetical protein
MMQLVDLRKCFAQTVFTFWTTLVHCSVCWYHCLVSGLWVWQALHAGPSSFSRYLCDPNRLDAWPSMQEVILPPARTPCHDSDIFASRESLSFYHPSLASETIPWVASKHVYTFRHLQCNSGWDVLKYVTLGRETVKFEMKLFVEFLCSSFEDSILHLFRCFVYVLLYPSSHWSSVWISIHSFYFLLNLIPLLNDTLSTAQTDCELVIRRLTANY